MFHAIHKIGRKIRFLKFRTTRTEMRFFIVFSWCFLLLGMVFFSSCVEPQKNTNPQPEDPFKNAKWVDLTHDLDENAHFWPNVEGFELDTVFAGMTDRDYYYSAYKFSAAEHGGTHIDAPVHFAEGKKSVEELTIDELTGYAVVLDVREAAKEDRDYQISIADFENWEAEHGEIPNGAMVLVLTGHDQYWDNKKEYMGTDEFGQEATQKLHFPGLSPKAAKWLTENRSIKGFGLDTPSVDYGPSLDFESHRILYGENIVGFENLTNLDQLSPKGDYIIALPAKIKGGSGGPLRIVALKRS